MIKSYYEDMAQTGKARLVENHELKAYVYLYIGRNNQPCAAGFSGRRTKPDFSYLFLNEEQKQNHIDKWLDSLRVRKADTEKRQSEKKAFKHGLKPDDILNTCWGYDQTNVDFYQVINVKSDKTVVIRKIGQDHVNREGFSSMSSFVTPCLNDFIGPAMLKRVSIYGIKIHGSATATKWGGKPQYVSWYA